MATAPRPPPRFVPTLTDVVRAPPLSEKALSAVAATTTSAVTHEPPAAVPLAKPAAQPAAPIARPVVAGTARVAASAKHGLSTPTPESLEDQLVRRVMARVEGALDQRLREATAKVVMEQTRALGPALRREIDLAVRMTVAQALAAEGRGADTQPAPGP